ncbi:hypothetical protein ACFL17_08185 [Pseudomonadota bacterium]
MNKQYDELSRRATKGDKDALRELFTLAEQEEGKKKFKEATVVFRDAAIAYRISAFRNLARAEDAESHAAWLATQQSIYRKWIDENPNGLRELPYPASGVTRGCIQKVVFGPLSHEESFSNLFLFLEESLSEIGMEFFSPGGTVQRRVCTLLGEVFGLGGVRQSQYLLNTAVRIGLDAMADEIIKRCHSA